MVDFLLQTQDLNQDGLLAPSELLSPPLPQSQVLSHNSSVRFSSIVIRHDFIAIGNCDAVVRFTPPPPYYYNIIYSI